jgi:hypothetical protein
MSPAAIATIRISDLPEIRTLIRVLLAEHVALHAYLAAALLRDLNGKQWSDLLLAHDAVAELLSSKKSDPVTPSTATELA